MDKTRVYKLLSDPKFTVALGVVVISGLTLFVPESAQAQAQKVLYGLWGIAITFILGHAFVDGKDREGSVPEGRKPVREGVVVQLGADPAEAVEGLEALPQHKLAAAADVLEGLGMPRVASTLRSHAEAVEKGVDPRSLGEPVGFKSNGAVDFGPAPEHTVTTTPGKLNPPQAASFNASRKIGILLVPLLLLCGLAGGCATSAPFAEGAYQAGKHIPRLAHGYAERDQGIDAVTRSTRTEAADELARATAVRKAVKFTTVRNAWRGVHGWYETYIEADPLIMDDTRALRLEMAREFDRLIGAEAKRSPIFTGPRE